MAQMPTFDHKVKFFPIGEDPFMLGPQLEEYLNGSRRYYRNAEISL